MYVYAWQLRAPRTGDVHSCYRDVVFEDVALNNNFNNNINNIFSLILYLYFRSSLAARRKDNSFPSSWVALLV